MQIKNLIVAAAAAGLVVVSATPALASEGLRVRNWARVTNNVITNSDTGNNSLTGKFLGGGSVDTGNATATGDVLSGVNLTQTDCGCGHLSVRNHAKVKNNVATNANTGHNSMHGWVVTDGSIDTGNAVSNSIVTNDVNTTIVGGGI